MPVDFPDVSSHSSSSTLLLVHFPFKSVFLPLLQLSHFSQLNLAPTPNPLWSLPSHWYQSRPLSSSLSDSGHLHQPSSPHRAFCGSQSYMLYWSFFLLLPSITNSLLFQSVSSLMHIPSPDCSLSQQGGVELTYTIPPVCPVIFISAAECDRFSFKHWIDLFQSNKLSVRSGA